MRILLGLALTLSVSFACDQPHEEVGGYNLGCEIADTSDLGMQVDSGYEGITTYSKRLNGDSFFDKESISIIDGKIEELSFTKSYPKMEGMYEGREALLDAMKNKWGNYEEKKLGGGYEMYVINDPRSDVIDEILVIGIGDRQLGSLSVTYISKKGLKYKKDEAARLKNEKLKKLQGF